MTRKKAPSTRRVAAGARQGGASGFTTLDYPLLSGTKAREAHRAEHVDTDREMASIVDEISATGIEEFVRTNPDKAWSLVVYLARCIRFAPEQTQVRASGR